MFTKGKQFHYVIPFFQQADMDCDGTLLFELVKRHHLMSIFLIGKYAVKRDEFYVSPLGHQGRLGDARIIIQRAHPCPPSIPFSTGNAFQTKIICLDEDYCIVAVHDDPLPRPQVSTGDLTLIQDKLDFYAKKDKRITYVVYAVIEDLIFGAYLPNGDSVEAIYTAKNAMNYAFATKEARTTHIVRMIDGKYDTAQVLVDVNYRALDNRVVSIATKKFDEYMQTLESAIVLSAQEGDYVTTEMGGVTFEYYNSKGELERSLRPPVERKELEAINDFEKNSNHYACLSWMSINLIRRPTYEETLAGHEMIDMEKTLH